MSAGISNKELHQVAQVEYLLDWSDQQRRIYTANGKAYDYYSPKRGYAIDPTELPHTVLLNGDTHAVFEAWKDAQQQSSTTTPVHHHHHHHSHPLSEPASPNPLVGVWQRTLYKGEWEYSTSRDEYVVLLQTHTLFMDLRIPHRRDKVIPALRLKRATSVDTLLPLQLRLYARQYAAAGFLRIHYHVDANVTSADTSNNNNSTHTTDASVASLVSSTTTATINTTTTKAMTDPQSQSQQQSPQSLLPYANSHCSYYPMCAVRHYAMDWNYLGVGHNRPHKWWVEWKDARQYYRHEWKKWSYARDDHGQHYYCEHWERMDPYQEGCTLDSNTSNNNNDTKTPVIAFRRRKSHGDGILIVIGDTFGYMLDRTLSGVEKGYPDAASLCSLVDLAVAQGDLSTAHAWLSMQAGTGRIRDNWRISRALEYWKEGTPLWYRSDVHICGSSIDQCVLMWKDEFWDLFECNLKTIEELRALLWIDCEIDYNYQHFTS
jgi:hypothetical protein